MATETPEYSKTHRLAVGDAVTYTDTTEWPPVTTQGTVKGFANDELTYLEVQFDEGDVRTLTEDDVQRVT